MSEKPRSRATFRDQWFGSITPGNAESIIKIQGRNWYALGGISIGAGCIMLLVSREAGLSLPRFSPDFAHDAIASGLFYITGGYFLVQRKSRTLAGILLIFALACLTSSILFRGNIVLAMMGVLIGWRGWRATVLYQRTIGHTIAWKNVWWISLSVLVIYATVFFSSLILLIRLSAHFDLAWLLAISAASISTAIFLAILTNLFPFHKATRPNQTEMSDNFLLGDPPIPGYRTPVPPYAAPENRYNKSTLGDHLADDEIYKTIAIELEQGSFSKGLWPRIFSETDGDLVKTKAIYIKERAAELMEVRRAAIDAEQKRAAELEIFRRAESVSAPRMSPRMPPIAKPVYTRSMARFVFAVVLVVIFLFMFIVAIPKNRPVAKVA